MFWKNRSVFLTGHSGFKGGWMAHWLHGLGANVTGYSLPAPTNPSFFESTRVAQHTNSVTGDIRDMDALFNAMRQAQPEVVFHLAAQSLVRYSYAHPIETLESNIMGTAKLLEVVRACPSVRAVVIVTSDKCYENREWLWGYRENEAMGGHDPYSASKGAAELVTASYRRSFFHPDNHATHGVGVASVRAGNVIGGGDWGADKLTADTIRAFAKNEAVNIRSPNATRPWQHVLEAIHGYLLLAERLHNGEKSFMEAFNFGPKDEDTKPVSYIVEHMAKLWGEGATWKIDKSPAPHEATLLKLDSTKAHTQLGWTPKLDVANALEWTVEFYKAHYAQEDLQALALAQISRYKALQGI